MKLLKCVLKIGMQNHHWKGKPVSGFYHFKQKSLAEITRALSSPDIRVVSFSGISSDARLNARLNASLVLKDSFFFFVSSSRQHEYERFWNNRHPHRRRFGGGSRGLGCVRLSQSSQCVRTNADKGKKNLTMRIFKLEKKKRTMSRDCYVGLLSLAYYLFYYRFILGHH